MENFSFAHLELQNEDLLMMRTLLLLLLLAAANSIFAQQELQTLELDDLSAFKDQAGNWSIVGKVLMNPKVDIHEPPPPPPMVDDNNKKRKRKRKRRNQEIPPPPPPRPKAVTFEAGTGILLNRNNDSIKDHLLTNWEHGDLLLELDVMIPKGSNSGIYLQGRYEVQLLDSWGVADPSYSDIGGIYRNWESEKGQIYMGKAPITNAAKAPGLWQHLAIAFRAPRFDSQGNKTENARFIYVDLNGVRIHENLEVPLPTGGPIQKNEVAQGPLMIQGDHGPVAFRNIAYLPLQERPIKLNNLEYQYFNGPVPDFQAFAGMEAAADGKMKFLNVNGEHPTDQFGMIISGTMDVPDAGQHELRLNHNGAVKLEIAGKTYDGNYRVGGQLYFSPQLKAGSNPFTIHYYKSDAWFDAGLGLFEVGSFPRPLHAYDSYPTTGRGAPPINVDVGATPRLLRAFLDFERDRKRRLTHTIGVGTPQGTHFIYDLKAGTPVCVWRGEFINATPMWNSRGDGSFRPRGAVQFLFAGSSVAAKEGSEAIFPNVLNTIGEFNNKGYRIDPATGMPIFLYAKDTLELEDKIVLEQSGHALSRTISFKGEAVPPQTYFAKLAEGELIETLPNGIFVIDQRYYIEVDSSQNPVIRTQGGKQELVADLTASPLTYIINW